MIQLRRWSSASLPAALRWQATSFLRIVWPSIDGGLLRDPYPESLEPIYYTVTREEDLLLSFAATYSASVTIVDTALTAACLGNVLTFPAARGQGLGRQVVEAASSDIRASEVDVAALLCAPELEPFYETSGWQAVPDSATVTSDGEVLDGLRMMLIVSASGRAAHQDLATQPLHVPCAW